ncbi:AraC family transcriptional regulator [Burkholderia cepacia]|uniref:AraC family transcriptional regulator n=1 Tax=Burkholderia cepacia TaxID=292 RepID=A0A0J5VTT0_BURCE|nr:AraC family transcriptional regulator [Burkholderia cepacia]KML41362.1 AraC family transcriptional regulator [Burkholderia cepacia]
MDKIHALGGSSLLQFFSSDDIPIGRGMGFWSAHLFKCAEVHVATDGAFHGRGFLCRRERGHFFQFHGASLDTRITESWLSSVTPDTYLAIYVLQAGGCTVETIGRPDARFGANELFMLDGGQPMQVHWDEPCFSSLRLPRSSIGRLLERGALDAAQPAISLQPTRLAPFLTTVLTLLGRHGPALSSCELDYMLARATDLGGVLLQATLSAHARRIALTRGDRLQAAYRYIDQNLHLQSLTPNQIADAVHCSRTQLYRLFRSEAYTVKEALREARLNRSFRYLEQPGLAISIGEVAHACGFPDQSTFGKLFRRRFGKTPGEVLRAARQRQVEPTAGAALRAERC